MVGVGSSGGGEGLSYGIKKVFDRKAKPKFECINDDILYARILESSGNEETDFIIFTKFGVLDYGKDIIRSIHFGLKFERQAEMTMPIEIRTISPTDQIKEVGTVISKDHKVQQLGGGVDLDLKSDTDLQFLKWHVGGGVKFKKQHDDETLATYSYPKQILVSRATGAGHDATWEFKQGEGAGWKGQYDLNIVFKIRKPFEDIKSGNYRYYVIFDVYINNNHINFDSDGPVKNSSVIQFLS